MNGVHQHQLAKTAPLEALVYSQPSNPNCRQRWIARQPFGFLRWEIQKWNAGSRQRVVGSHTTCGHLNHDKTICDSPADVLSHLRLKVSVKRVFAAAERGSIMPVRERLEAKRDRGHSTPNSSR
jgi:hypothetical protein